MLAKIKEMNNKSLKDILKDMKYDTFVLMRLFSSILITVIATYQFKPLFEKLHELINYPFATFITGYAIIFVFAVIFIMVHSIMKYIIKKAKKEV